MSKGKDSKKRDTKKPGKTTKEKSKQRGRKKRKKRIQVFLMYLPTEAVASVARLQWQKEC
ncbi:MAG: hypothetical protein M5U34_09915 [Chloroflexi bacterium]|nr:hypothetical protein [Chloroflexota bacterium]